MNRGGGSNNRSHVSVDRSLKTRSINVKIRRERRMPDGGRQILGADSPRPTAVRFSPRVQKNRIFEPSAITRFAVIQETVKN